METEFKSYRKESRTDWGVTLDQNTQVNREQIQLGAILRIADATEAMAKNHVQLLSDLAYYKKRAEERHAEILHLRARLAGYKGAIGRLQRKVAES